MSKIFVFAGTTEGRLISEFLCENKIEHRVFVATDYGETVLQESPYAKVEVGRLNGKQMEELFRKEKPVLVIDGTHPYAIEATSNIRSAIDKCLDKINYIRVAREIEQLEDDSSCYNENVVIVHSNMEAVDCLRNMPGNVLLTTGIKNVSDYCVEGIKERIYARILPSSESLDIAFNNNLKPRQIIAMEGPFSTELNMALIEQFDIKVLVSKNSGKKGGFQEKLEACKLKNISALIIEKDSESDGVSLDDAKTKILEIINEEDVLIVGNSTKDIAIVGIGVGNDASMTVASKKAILEADLIIGASRMINIGRNINQHADTISEYESKKVLEAINSTSSNRIAILVSGDSGFYSGAKAIYDELSKEGMKVKMLPAVSSISYFASLINIPYSDGILTSSHGITNNIAEKLLACNKVFAIVSGTDDINKIILDVKSVCSKGMIYVGYNLGMNDERIESFPIVEDKKYYDKGLYVIGVVRDE